MNLDFAITRVFELETKQEVHVNRLMLAKYLDALKIGLHLNEEEYFTAKGIDPELGRKQMLET